MKAIVRDRYGPPDILELREVDPPEPGEGEVLVQVRAASVNPYDWHFLRGEPYFMRAQAGLRKPKMAVLGADIPGVVDEVGTRPNSSLAYARLAGGGPVKRDVCPSSEASP